MRYLLRKYRGNRSQSTMANLYGVTQQTWCKWEQNKGFPRAPLMQKIAQDSGYSVTELFFSAT